LHEVKDVKIKYLTKAAEFYRRKNLALATGKPFEESEPSFDEGRTLLNGNTLDQNNQVINVIENLAFAQSQLIEEEEEKTEQTRQRDLEP